MEFSGIADEAGAHIETQVKAHSELGWGLIELRNIDGVCITDLPDREFDRVLGLCTGAGIRISCFASQIGNWSRPITGDFETDKAELARAIPRMKKAGTRFIRIMSWTRGDAEMEDWRAEALRRVKELAKTAEGGGVVLAHENCSGWASEGPAETLEMLETVDSPALALIYDTANPLAHGKDTWQFVQGLKDHAAYVHVKDWKIEPDGSGHGVYPGEGQSMLRDQLAEIFRTGYDGVISIEPHVAAIIHEHKEAGDPEAAYHTYVEYGRRLEKLVKEVRANL